MRASTIDCALLAVRVARLHGLTCIATRGDVPWRAIALAAPELAARALASPMAFEDANVVEGTLLIDLTDAADIDDLADLSERANVTLVHRLTDPTALRDLLVGRGVHATFVGRAPGGAGSIAIVDRRVNDSLGKAPDGFRVLAIVTAFNEEDVIEGTIASLTAAGVEVHLIDNWSTDRTRERAARHLGRGLMAIERFPESPSATYDWTNLLSRVEAIAEDSGADWAIHHDSDERHVAPWPGIGLRDALWAVQASGFNAVDHTVLNFRPVDDGFPAGSDLEAYFHHFELGRTPDDLLRIKAWHAPGEHASLAATGGHEVRFPGRRVFPYKFLLKHYPVRSQAHGERKVLRERVARWNAAERAKGWHVHYDAITEGHRFIRSPNELEKFDDFTVERELVGLISGVGLAPRPFPIWAAESATGAAAFRIARAVASAGRAGARRSGLMRTPLGQRAVRALRGSGGAPR